MALLASVTAFAWCLQASAEDLGVALVDAQTKLESATTEVSELESKAQAAKSRSKKSNERAAPAMIAARESARHARKLEADAQGRRVEAKAAVARIEGERRDAADEHSAAVRDALGIALAALIAAGIAASWGWFRATALVAWLARLPFAQAVGLCVGGGLLTVIVGGALGNADGLAGVIGAALFLLGFVPAIALVLACHSAEVQRRRSKPLLGRERLPRRATQGVAIALGLLCVIGVGSAVFAGESETSTVSASLRANASSGPIDSPPLTEAKREASRAFRQASGLITVAHRDKRAWQLARSDLSRAEGRVSNAEDDISSIETKLAKLAKIEDRKAQERAEEEEALAAENSACDPNYEGRCLDPNAIDYDCAGGSGDGPEYTGTVTVVGVDHYDLDSDNDGVACES